MATASTLKIESSRLTNPDGDGKVANADAVDYDNATSGLAATDVQSALDEVAADGFVTAGRLATLAVTAGKIAASAVGEDEIENLAVTTSKVDDRAITSGKINPVADVVYPLSDTYTTTDADLGKLIIATTADTEITLHSSGLGDGSYLSVHAHPFSGTDVTLVWGGTFIGEMTVVSGTTAVLMYFFDTPSKWHRLA